MTTYKLGLESETTGCHYVVVEVPNKPTQQGDPND